MIDRRCFLKALGAGAVGLVGARFVPGEGGGQGRPNIVYILADDMGYGDLACQNSESKIATPNLDRLASEGIRFTDAHSPSAVCSPTRYGILTGRYCWRTRLKRSVLWQNLCNEHPDVVERLTKLLKKYRDEGHSWAMTSRLQLENSARL